MRTAYAASLLIRAGNRGAPIAVDAVWQAWLCSPEPRWWTALRRWRQPAGPGSELDSGAFPADRAHHLSLAALDDPAIGWSPEGIADAATMTGHPIAAIAEQRILHPGDGLWIDDICLAAVGRPRLVEWLGAHGLAPAVLSTRAAYLLLTGQQQEYWDLDPDQSLLTAAYRERPDLRPALRHATDAFGDLDPVRLMSGVRVNDDDIAFLSRRLTRDRDWDALWRLARDLPPADAVRVLRDMDPEWRPPPGADGLYALLRTTDEHHLRERADLLTTPSELAVDGMVVQGAFSQDDRMLAVTTTAIGTSLWVFDLDAGTPPEGHRVDGLDFAPLSFEGHRPLLSQPWRDRPQMRSTVWRFDPGGRSGRPLPGRARCLLPLSGDGTTQIALVCPTVSRDQERLMLVRRSGPPALRPPRILAPPGARPQIVTETAGQVLATQPAARRVALAGSRIMVAELAPRNTLRGLAVSRPLDRLPRSLWLGGDGELVSGDDARITRWRTDGTALKVAAETYRFKGQLAGVPCWNAVAVHDRGRGLRYLDAETLAPIDRPGGLAALRGPGVLWSSPTGSHATALDGRIHVALAAAVSLADLARRPMAEATGADHATLADARARPALRERAGILLDVLEAAHRQTLSTPGETGR